MSYCLSLMSVIFNQEYINSFFKYNVESKLTYLWKYFCYLKRQRGLNKPVKKIWNKTQNLFLSFDFIKIFLEYSSRNTCVGGGRVSEAFVEWIYYVNLKYIFEFSGSGVPVIPHFPLHPHMTLSIKDFTLPIVLPFLSRCE